MLNENIRKLMLENKRGARKLFNDEELDLSSQFESERKRLKIDQAQYDLIGKTAAITISQAQISKVLKGLGVEIQPPSKPTSSNMQMAEQNEQIQEKPEEQPKQDFLPK